MSTKTKADAAEPTVAELLARIAELEAAKAATPVVDFSDEVAAASSQGFTAQVVPSLQKGAQPALRVDY